MTYTRKEQIERKKIIKKIIAQLLKTVEWHMEFGEPIDGRTEYHNALLHKKSTDIKVYGVMFSPGRNAFIVITDVFEDADPLYTVHLEDLWTTTLVAINKYLEKHLGQ